MMNSEIKEHYRYVCGNPTWSNHYIWPVLKNILASADISDKRVFEIGCGNGSTANMLIQNGYDVCGIDSSESGIKIANQNFPDARLFDGSAYDDLAERFGQFPIVISLEVIEHCFEPKSFMRSFYNLLEVGGIGIISTPYHGYFKNLAISLAGKWDDHFTALWDGGHIKFWSEKTLTKLLQEVGFQKVNFVRAGRLPIVAKSMIAIVRKTG